MTPEAAILEAIANCDKQLSKPTPEARHRGIIDPETAHYGKQRQSLLFALEAIRNEGK